MPSDIRLNHENRYWETYERVVGIDEVGRGCWAGDLVVAAYQFPRWTKMTDDLFMVRDSKKLTEVQRTKMDHLLRALPESALGIGTVSAEEIDTYGLSEAISTAAWRAVANLRELPQIILCDQGLHAPEFQAHNIPSVQFTHGESVSLSIAAASIIAKVYRDRQMIICAETYTGYGFERHKGYGTLEHRKALQKYGPLSIHRKSFKPIRELIEKSWQ